MTMGVPIRITVSRRAFDMATGLCLLLIGAFVWREGVNMPPSFLDSEFGSGYLPSLAGGALVLLSCLLMLEASRDKTGGTAFVLDGDMRGPLFTCLALILFIANLALNFVPFYPAAALMIFCISVGLGGRTRREILIAAACAIVATGLSWVVFTRIFVVMIG